MKKDPVFIDWFNASMPGIISAFAETEAMHLTPFIQSLNKTFTTKEFDTFLRKYLLEETGRIFDSINKTHRLKDNPFNRYLINSCREIVKNVSDIHWIPETNHFVRMSKILFFIAYMAYAGLKNGITLCKRSKKYKVMREALWGLERNGYYFHDDFLVDDKIMRKDEILLYSRGTPDSGSRKGGYQDAIESEYNHFILGRLPISLRVFFFRFIPKYCISSSVILIQSCLNPDFDIIFGLFKKFSKSALDYEKVLSNFQVSAEFGHNYFSSSHIAERIICQNYGMRYYLAGWSDISGKNDQALFAFLSCDELLLWGIAYTQGVEGENAPIRPIGCFLKRFIQQVHAGRANILKQMGITPEQPVITFFDQAFNSQVKTNENHFISFWETALKTAQQCKDAFIIIKPKGEHFFDNLSDKGRMYLNDLKLKITDFSNVKILKSGDWSFIEAIGISDIVVTQGMNTSSMLANISGITGLYLNEAQDKHIFCERFKDKLVFDAPDGLIDAISNTIIQKFSPTKIIPEHIMREFDAYKDNDAIDRLRTILAGHVSEPIIKKKIGIIVQARMGSTRLPGKVMKEIGGKSILNILIDRLKQAECCDEIIIATTNKIADQIIVQKSLEAGVKIYRGDENDVLRRYYEAAKENSLDVIVRITSDCPLADPILINDMINKFLSYDSIDYLSNTLERTFPRGFDAEVFRFKALKKAFKKAVKPHQREHVTPYIYEHLNCINYPSEIQNTSDFRVTVDTLQDFKLVSAIFSELKGLQQIGYKDVISLLTKKPELTDINKEIKQKALVV